MRGKNILHRVVNKCIKLYQCKEENIGKESLGYCGNNVILAYPFILGEPESISIGEGTTILANARLQVYNYLLGGRNAGIEIGSNCYITHRFCVLAGAKVSIGDNVLIASDVTITSENHSFNPEEKIPYMDQKLNCAPVVVGEGTWIGQGVIILPGVTIGERCVIGAGAVVTKDIPSHTVSVGNPAKVIKKYDFNIQEWLQV